MAEETIIKWLKIDDGTNTLIAKTNNHQVTGATSGIWVSKLTGLIEPGPSTAEAKSRSFANGSVLSIRNNFGGKVINVSFLISNPIKENLELIESLIQANRVYISSGFKSKIYTAQFQSDGYTLEWDAVTKTYEASLIFACEEAF